MTDEMTEGSAPEKRPHRKTPPATPAVQAWLDGETPREGLATADEQETAELWARINQEAEQLRRRHTPIQLQSRILSSLPATPVVQEPPPAVSKMSPMVLVIGGIVMLVLGVAVGYLLVN